MYEEEQEGGVKHIKFIVSNLECSSCKEERYHCRGWIKGDICGNTFPANCGAADSAHQKDDDMNTRVIWDFNCGKEKGNVL